MDAGIITNCNQPLFFPASQPFRIMMMMTKLKATLSISQELLSKKERVGKRMMMRKMMKSERRLSFVFEVGFRVLHVRFCPWLFW